MDKLARIEHLVQNVEFIFQCWSWSPTDLLRQPVRSGHADDDHYGSPEHTHTRWLGTWYV